ncbi:PC-esterase domain-containing protein 1A-like [Saccostrea echinata]|uniref:PC-esterase domain-containing protein 1A-like n=1 Tax=Saccostrea echinata TaxID=191078 RepID=UPI002A7F03C8|nr:PC-esterase domain-containing protein 1A-like [Saccostrea echinata]XP_061184627.1 PC-esterase domain-containing protein 1A-like [Saccostrea echinata]
MVMSDIFLNEDIIKLLHNKFVIIIGDSIQRAIYKDLVMLLQKNLYLKDKHLRNKGEMSFERDELIEGGRKGLMSNGVNYREIRQYHRENHLIRFYFVTRCYNTYMESILSDISKDPKPDIIIMNSCLWDISRYGKNGVEEYKVNLVRLFDRLKEVVSPDCLVIWNATLPISKNVRGGFLIPGVEFMNSTLRLDILEANFYAQQVVVSHGYDLLDLHYYMRNQLHRRAGDGVHWDQTAHRRMTNLLLTHISEAWRLKLPGRSEEIRQLTEQVGQVLPSDTGRVQFSGGHQYRRGSNHFRGSANTGRCGNLREPVVDYRSPVSNLYASSRNMWNSNNNVPSETAPNPNSHYQRREKATGTCYKRCQQEEEDYYYCRQEQLGESAKSEEFHKDLQIPTGDRFHMIDINSNLCAPFTWKPYSEQNIPGCSKPRGGFNRKKNPYHMREKKNRKDSSCNKKFL